MPNRYDDRQSRYDDSPYMTLPHDLLLRDPSLTVAQKFVDDKEFEVSNSLRLIPHFFESSVEKTIRIVTLMSALTERQDNQVNGGKDILHPLYLVSRFIPEDSVASGCCVFRINIRPPQGRTNFLEDEYDRFKELLAHYGVKSKLENYNGAMSKENWIRKLLVVYMKLDVNGNNDGRFKIVAKTGKEGLVVDYVSFRVVYGTTENLPLRKCFFARTLSQWCRNAMKWVAEILEDQSERKFKKTYLYEIISKEGPPMEDPEGEDGSDLMEWLLRERPKQQKLNDEDDEKEDDNEKGDDDQPGDSRRDKANKGWGYLNHQRARMTTPMTITMMTRHTYPTKKKKKSNVEEKKKSNVEETYRNHP